MDFHIHHFYRHHPLVELAVVEPLELKDNLLIPCLNIEQLVGHTVEEELHHNPEVRRRLVELMVTRMLKAGLMLGIVTVVGVDQKH